MGERSVLLSFETPTGTCLLTDAELILKERELTSTLSYKHIQDVRIRKGLLGAHPKLIVKRNHAELEIACLTGEVAYQAQEIIRRKMARTIRLR